MTLGSKRRLTVLFAIAVLLIATQGAVANTVEIGSIHGWLGPGKVDVYDLGLASDWIGSTARVVVFPDPGLDIIVCFFLIVFDPNSTPRQLTCTDSAGPGGPERATEYISNSDFPNAVWLFNAHLGLVLMAYSGSGNYSGRVYVNI